MSDGVDDTYRIRALVNDACGALTRVAWRLPEGGVEPGSVAAERFTPEQIETRTRAREAARALVYYLGLYDQVRL